MALSLSPRGVVNAKQVVADALDSHSGEPVEVGGGGGGNGGDSLRRASSSVEVLKDTLGSDQVPLGAAAGTKQSSKRHCMLCRQRFASAVALNQHIKQQHQCAQCGEIARVAYRVDADGAARRLCSRCAVAELLAAAQPGAPRVLRDMPPSPNHGIIPIAPVAPLSPRSAYVQAVLQARVRAASRGTSPEREPSPSKHETSSLNSSGGVANPRARRNTKTQHLRRGSHDIARSAPTTPTTPTTTAGTTPTTPTTTTPTTPTTTGDVPPPLPPDQIRADDDRFVAEPPPPLLPNPTIQAARMEQQEQEEEE